MSDPYTIVLWCSDFSRFASMVGAHLLGEGLHAANRGRIDDEIPIVVGVANARRWPIFSREVSSTGLVRYRFPRVGTTERYDYLLTFTSGKHVDATNAPASAHSVIDANHLVQALESLSPSELSRLEVISIFAGASQPAVTSSQHIANDKVQLREIADTCQRLIIALAR
ncbi:MAG: hypothetical protein ACKOYI_09650 [Actinomycetota bacterium]